MFNPETDTGFFATQDYWRYSVENEGGKDAVNKGDVVEIRFCHKKDWDSKALQYNDDGTPLIEAKIFVKNNDIEEKIWCVNLSRNNAMFAIQKGMREYDPKSCKLSQLLGLNITATSPPRTK